MKSYEPKTYRQDKPQDRNDHSEENSAGPHANPPGFNLSGKHKESNSQAIQRSPEDENDTAGTIADPQEEEDLDREAFHMEAEENPEFAGAKENLGDSFYDIVDALFEIDYAEMERYAMLSEIKELPFGVEIDNSYLMCQELKDYLHSEIAHAGENADDIDFENIEELSNAAVDIRSIMEMENDLARAKTEEYNITHNEYLVFIRAYERMPEIIAKQQLKEYEDKLAQIKSNLAKAESEKNGAYLEAGINIGLDLVGIFAFSNPWTAGLYGLGTWALSTQYLDEKLGPELDGATKTSSDVGDDKQLADTAGGTAKDLKKPPPPGSPKVSKYGKAGFGFNRLNDGLEIKTAYDNIEKLEGDKENIEDKIEAQEKTVRYEENMSRIKKEFRENKASKRVSDLRDEIWELEHAIYDATEAFNKQYKDVAGEI